MDRISVSPGEIFREGPWALRALGYPFGVADRATPMVVWAELVHGIGLKLMRLGEDQISRTATLPPPPRQHRPDGMLTINAAGKCLLEVGPVAIDLATNEARRTGVGRIEISNVTGLCLTDSLLEMTMKRDLGALLAFNSGRDEIAPNVFSVSGWLGAAAFKNGSIIVGGPLDTLDKDIIDATSCFMDGAAYTSNAVPELMRSARDAASNKSSVLMIQLTSGAAAANQNKSAAAARFETDYLERIRQGYRRGVKTDKEDFEFLYTLEKRTWAPTSERSRRQAGF